MDMMSDIFLYCKECHHIRFYYYSKQFHGDLVDYGAVNKWYELSAGKCYIDPEWYVRLPTKLNIEKFCLLFPYVLNCVNLFFCDT